MNSNKETSVAMIIRRFTPLIGGTEKQAERLAQKLIEKGIHVNLITSRFDKRWKRVEYLKALKVIRLSSPPIKILGTLIFLISLLRYLLQYRSNYQIIHVHLANYEAFWGIFWGNILKKKIVLKLASGDKCGKIMGELFRLNNSLRGKIILTGIKKAHRFIATTSHIKNHLLEFGFLKNQIIDIPNGVDIETFRPKSLPNPGSDLSQCKKILFVGRLSEEKGVISLIKAWRILLDWYREDEQLLLEILGDGPQRMECLRLVKALGIADSVKFMGNIINVEEHLMNGDIFVLPSYFEGLSNALLEAMSCALPIVATRVSGNEAVIEDGFNGILVEPDNPSQIAEKILLLLKEKEFALRLGQNARMTVEDKFSLDIVAGNYINLYKELLTMEG